jgi:aminoglycoside 6'-N-acetyltransferase
MLLRGDRVTLRDAAAGDVTSLLAVLADPEVARWWGASGRAELERDLADPSVTIMVIEVDGAVAGLIQFSEEEEPDYRHASIDIVLASPWQDRGLGPDAIRTLARHLFDVRDHHRLTIDPAASNARAIAAYTGVGFKPVGVMRRYERGPDGTWHDGLLMDLLREDFGD